MWEVIKKIKWWMWIGVVIVILLFWQYLTGWSTSRKLYTLALDNLRTDQTVIVRTLEQTITQRETELADLYKKVDIIQKQRATAQAESERLRGLVDAKNTEIIKLRKEREAITVPTDITPLADEFRKRGYSPTVILPTR